MLFGKPLNVSFRLRFKNKKIMLSEGIQLSFVIPLVPQIPCQLNCNSGNQDAMKFGRWQGVSCDNCGQKHPESGVVSMVCQKFNNGSVARLEIDGR